MIKIYGFGFQEISNKFISVDFMKIVHMFYKYLGFLKICFHFNENCFKIGSFLRTYKRVKRDVVPMASHFKA